MRFTFIIALMACGPTTHFTYDPASLPKDVAMLRNAASLVNAEMRCGIISLAEGSPHAYDIRFGTNAQCGIELLQGYDGLTTTEGFSGDAQLCLRSWATRPVEGDGIDYSYDAGVSTDLHELGHAMGLQHTKNPDDIMYFEVPYVQEYIVTAAKLARYAEQLHHAGITCK